MSEETKGLELLPTGKYHVSYSEVRSWKECSFRHKLQQVDKIDLSRVSPIPDFGTACHAACEHFLNSGKMDDDVALKKLEELWKDHDHKEPIEQFKKEAIDILEDVPAFFDETFPGWKPISAESQLYEKIGDLPHAFKGYIDCVIEVPGKRGNPITWILDFKTTSWGWHKMKVSDDLVRSQIVLYKSFWAQKNNVDPKNVKCGFVLLKRSAKKGKHCQLISVSAGDVTTKRSLKMVTNMVAGVKRGLAIKNRDSCTFCEYYQTEWCK